MSEEPDISPSQVGDCQLCREAVAALSPEEWQQIARAHHPRSGLPLRAKEYHAIRRLADLSKIYRSKEGSKG